MASNKRLNATITIGGAISGTLKSALGSTRDKLRDIGSTIRNLEKEQRLLGKSIQEFGRMGKNVDGMRARYAAVTAEIDKARKAQDKMIAGQKRAEFFKSAATTGGKVVGAVAAVGASALVPIIEAAKFEKAMLGVAKQVDGARDSSGKLTQVYYDMAGQIQKLARETPIATNEIADMVAAGARMGIAKDELIGFTRNAAMMASAFDLPAGQLADDMGKIANLFHIPIPAIGGLADAINYLDDNTLAKGPDIIEFLTRTGGVASSVKITGNAMAAIGSTLLTLGERSETASTATNAFFQKLAAADKGTKKFKEAMAEIGLSTASIQKGMQTDAAGTILKVLDAVNKLPAEKRLGNLVEMVGLEHSDTIAKMVANVGELRNQMAMANSEAAQGSMGREYAAQLATTNAQWTIFVNKATEVGVAIGTILLPPINSLMTVLGDVVTKLVEFATWAKVPDLLSVSFRVVGETIDVVIGKIMQAIEWVKTMGSAWESAKSFFGFSGDGATMKPPGAGSPSVGLPSPSIASSKSGDSSATQNNNFVINQIPGQDSKQLADEIAKRMREKQGVSNRSIMFDAPKGY